MKLILPVVVALGCLTSVPAYGAGGGGGVIPSFINYYGILCNAFGIEEAHHTRWIPVFSSVLVLILLTIAGFLFKASVEKYGDDVAPKRKFSPRFLMETALDIPYSVAKDNCGKDFQKYLPLMCGLFVFILFTNLTGLVPGFPPATEFISTNIAMGLIVFIVYNYAGIKEHGAGYIKHFLGPVAFIAPLFFVIEIISHGSRPLSLGLRLAGNIFGDHLLLGVFTGLTYLVLPVALMFFGLLVAVVQSFIFTLLSGIYISMAISHDH